jgi:hypothetical protein
VLALGGELPDDAREFSLEALDLVDELRGDHLGERRVQVVAVFGELRSPTYAVPADSQVCRWQ